MASRARLTVVVASGDRPADLRQALGGLAAQSGEAHGTELVVVTGDGSPVPGARSLACSRPEAEARWKAGAEAATGDLLLFMSDDLVPEPRMLESHLALHAEDSSTIGVGQGTSPNGGSGLARHLDTHPLGTLPFEGVSRTFSVSRGAYTQAGGMQRLERGGLLELAYRLRMAGGAPRRLAMPAGKRHHPLGDAGVVHDLEQAGADAARLYRQAPQLLPYLALGGFEALTPSAPWLRRRLLAAGAPPCPTVLGRLLRRHASIQRWYRFVRDYAYWRGARRVLRGDPDWQSLVRPPVILMYHALGAPGEPAGQYIVPSRRFARQMAWLGLARYRVIGLEELLACRREHRLPPGRAVVVTFDDGYADNWRFALPILRARGFPATVFVVSGRIGERNTWDGAGELDDRPLLTWNEIRELLGAGIEVGAHTRHHVALTTVDRCEADREIAGSRTDLEEALGRPLRTFAYPYGLLDDATPAAVAKAGFHGACCSRSGVNDPAVPSHLLRRVEIRGTDSMLQFIRSVRLGRTGRRPRVP